MRDYTDAIRTRVVLFDGGMGATLEQLDLSLEHDYKLPGRAHEALVLNRPDVIEHVHQSFVEAGADVVQTDTFQASRLKLDEWGLGEQTVEINRRAAEIARKAAGEERFVAGSIGPTGFLPASDDPTLGEISFRTLADTFSEQAGGLIEGGVDVILIETAQDILEVKAAVFGAREAMKHVGREVPIQTQVSLLPNGGKMLLGTDISAVLTTLEALGVDAIGLNCSTGPEDMRDAIRFLGEFSPLPVSCIPNAGIPIQGPDGETIFPEGPEQFAKTLIDFVDRYDVSIVGGCCGTTPDHIRVLAEGVKGAPGEAAPGAAPDPRQLDDRRDPARPGAAPDDGRRARQLAGLAQGQGDAARRRLRRAQPDRRGPGRRRRARARSLRRARRARRRGRADAPRRRARLALAAGADPGRLDRARGDRGRARADSRARDRQLDQPRGRPRQARPRRAARARPRRLPDRADDRRGRDGEDGRAQARDRPAPEGAVLRRARPRPRGADLRLPDVHADDRRGGVAPVGGRDDRGHPARQGADPRGQDVARRLERLVRRRAARARRPELGLPAPLRRRRAGPRDGQPEPHHAVRRDQRGRARARRRSRAQPPRGRARAVHRALRVAVRGRRGGGRRPDRGHGARGGAALPHPAPQEGGRRGLDRPLGREDRRRPDAQRRAAAGDEGGRRQVRRRRADPALRPAVGDGHEARRRAAREVPRQGRGLHEGHRRDRDGLRRRARHRQVARQHDPHEQRLHGRRPRQAGADLDDPRGRPGARRDGDRAQRAARVDVQADAAARSRSCTPRASSSPC